MTAPVPVWASIEVDEEEVVFRLDDQGAAKVFLTGDFNNWNPKMDSMVKRGGAWELRLYLVPGRYRYMFVVDGVNLPDPDNPNKDADGNTFFIFVEEEGVYKIVYEVTETGERKIDEKYEPYGAMTATAVEDYGLFTASAGVDGEIDGTIHGNILIGAEYETTAEEPIKAYLVRAKGEWVTEKFQLGAFHRSGRIGFDDPLSLFTDVGPYAYPLDLFCRGAEASAGWENSIEGRIFFANRIDSYKSGLNLFHSYPTFEYRSPVDKDMIGADIKGSFGSFRLEYLLRYDNGPEMYYEFEDGTDVMGYGKRTSHGLLFEFGKDDWPVLKLQHLSGATSLEAGQIIYPDTLETGKGPSDYDRDWKEGYRALAGISWSKGPLWMQLEWQRTTMERKLDHEYYWDDAEMDIYGAGLKYDTKMMNIGFDIDFIDFSGSGGQGLTFWLSGSNFWLDGDMIRTELLQFLESKRMWRTVLELEESGVDVIPGPYRLEGYLKAKANWDTEESRSMFEISGGKGIRAGSYLSLHTDLRYVSYSDDRWVGESNFFDIWAGLRGSLGGSGWAALGIGVAPHRFDRWYFGFTGDGRENYLLDQDFFETHSWTADPDPLGSLGEAEKQLSEEWRLSFEAGFSF